MHQIMCNLVLNWFVFDKSIRVSRENSFQSFNFYINTNNLNTFYTSNLTKNRKYFLGQYKCVCNCILYISANSRAKELKAINFSLSAFLTYNNAKSRSKAVFKREPMSSMLKSIFFCSIILFFIHSS